MPIHFTILFAAVSCGTPSEGTHCSRAGNDFTFSKKVTYSCDTGYEVLSGDDTRTCQANKTWTGQPIICSRNIDFFVNRG